MSLADYHHLPRCRPACWLQKSPLYRSLSSLSAKAWYAWAIDYLKHGLGPRLPLPSGEANIDTMPDKTTMALCGDWATDTFEALEVANLIRRDASDYTVNLGDVYRVGTPDEVEQNVFGEPRDADDGRTPERWPLGKIATRWLNANHDMMARGTGLFHVLLPRIKQATTWWALQNANWVILGLDTGYNSASLFHRDAALPKQCVEWVRSHRGLLLGRAIILLTHHQPISAFDDNEYPAAARQLSEFINRPVLWFWGHEHRASTYGPWRVDPYGFTFHGHCCGHGGMPVYADDEIERHDRPLLWADTRTQKVDGITVGYNGYAALEFDGPRLVLKYIDINSVVQRTEQWTAHGAVPQKIYESQI